MGRERASGRIGTRRGALLAAALLSIVLTGCATRPTDPEDLARYEELNDPLEPMNRAIFEFNMTMDKFVLRPVAIGYRKVIPRPIRITVRNFLDNLRAPIVLLNDILQGEGERAGETFGRFMANTIGGLGGLIDIASGLGIPKHDEDFGQTLAVWGAGSGPYLILPFLGPSNPRDGIGLAVDAYADPIATWAANHGYDKVLVTRYVVDQVDRRAANIETLDQLQASSIDFYAAVRSFYRQYRKSEISNGRMAEQGEDGLPPMVDFDSMDMPDEEEEEIPKEGSNEPRQQ